MSGNWNVEGDWDENEPPFDDEEISWAAQWRQSVFPDPRLTRKDHCPHPVLCRNVAECVQFIAWYKRHQKAIEGL